MKNRRHSIHWTILVATLALAGVVARLANASPEDAMVERERSRFEELFIQNMTKELKLSGFVEASFTKAIRRLNREKAQANDDVASALVALEKAQSASRTATPVETKAGRPGKKQKVPKVATVKSETEKALRRYEKAMSTYSALPMLELSRLRKILGIEKLGQYLIAKSQMAEKLKALSAREAAPSATPLNTPPSMTPAAAPTSTPTP